MQTEESARRVIDIGADPAKVVVTGSLKFDSLDVPGAPTLDGRGQNRVLRYFRMTSGRPVIVAGSTMRDEEQIVLQAFRRIKASTANPLLVLAPRHPERFAEVAQLARDQAFVTAKRTDLQIDAEPRADVVVLDTIGELAQVYQIATAVFVGGSLVDTGGHNILEPAVFGKPIVFGPHMHNFKEIAEAFVAQDAAIQVHRPARTRRGAARLADRSGAARPAGRRGARPRRVESRREGQVPRDDRAAVAAARRHDGRRPPVPRGPLTFAGSSLQPTRSRATPVLPAPALSEAASRRARHQHRESHGRRQRQDAARRRDRARAARDARASVDSQPRVRQEDPRRGCGHRE